MGRIKEIKNRIKSVKDVQQITKAMKMVAAAKLRKIEQKYDYASEYFEKQQQLISFMISKNRWASSPFLQERTETFKGYIVLSGDKGLCGGFNLNVIKKINSEVTSEQLKQKIKFFGVGKKANFLLKKDKFNLLMDERGIFGKVCYEDASRIANEVLSSFLNGEVSSVSIILNRFKSHDENPVDIIPVLPLSVPDSDEDNQDFMYDSGIESVLDSLLPYYFSLTIYKYLIESEAAEFLARMTAMDAASENANDLIDKLTLEYNRARQSSITTELIDIVGGAEALK